MLLLLVGVRLGNERGFEEWVSDGIWEIDCWERE